MTMSFSMSQAAKEERLLELCHDVTTDIRDFSSLLSQGVDPDIYDQVGATRTPCDRQLSVLT